MDFEKLGQQLMDVCAKYYHITLTSEDLQRILSLATVKHYADGDILCSVGDPLHETGLVLQGVIRSYYLTPDGKDISRYFHVQYSMAMDDALLGFPVSQYVCEAIGDVSVLMFPIEPLKLLIDNNPAFREIYLKSLESGLRYKLYRENELMTKDATGRYQQFVQDFPELVQKVKQAHIATYLGIEPQSLSRIRKRIKEESE